LHGSEGGTMGAARAAAVRFAQLGYAAFAVNYFAYPNAGIKNIPAALLNIPVETVNIAREWLQKKPDVDTERIALWGVSKGAELALVAAAQYGWVDRVAACVPSSFVWAGFGRATAEGEAPSSWTVGGRSLRFI